MELMPGFDKTEEVLEKAAVEDECTPVQAQSELVLSTGMISCIVTLEPRVP